MTIKVKLERVHVDPVTNDHTLLIRNDDGTERRIDLGRIQYGGMTLVNYEVSQRGGQKILSAFFYINYRGHELDRWMHFDLETAKEIEGYVNPMQAAGRNPEENRIETEEDVKILAARLRELVDHISRKNEETRSE